MKKASIRILVSVLSLSLVCAFGCFVAYAEPTDSSDTTVVDIPSSSVQSSAEETVSSVPQTTDNEVTTSNVTGSDEASSEETVSGETVSGETASEETTSGETTSEGTTSGVTSSGETSSSTTSSKKPNTTTSQGMGGGGSTFIDESGNVVVVPETNEGDSATETDETEPTVDTDTKKMGSVINKIIWIPIVFGVLSIAGLVYINVFYAKKYKETKKNSKELFGVKPKAKRKAKRK